METLAGRRILLEPVQTAHLPDLCKIGLEPKLWQFTTIEVVSAEAMARYIKHALASQSQGTARPYVIRLKQNGDVIGTSRYHHIEPKHKRAEIGFTWFGLPWQGKGYNTEAKLLMLERAFEEWGFHRVEFRADAENLPSRKALEAIGARFECIQRSFMISERSGPRDIAVYAIVDEDWPDLKAKLQTKLARCV